MDQQLEEQSAANGGNSVAKKMKEFSRKCARYYVELWDASLYQQAEWLRTLAYHWAGRYERVTGKRESPGICTLDWQPRQKRLPVLVDALSDAERSLPSRLAFAENLLDLPDIWVFSNRNLADWFEKFQQYGLFNLYYSPLESPEHASRVTLEFLLSHRRFHRGTTRIIRLQERDEGVYQGERIEGLVVQYDLATDYFGYAYSLENISKSEFLQDTLLLSVNLQKASIEYGSFFNFPSERAKGDSGKILNREERIGYWIDSGSISNSRSEPRGYIGYSES